MPDQSQSSHTVYVLAPTANDSAVAVDVLRSAGIAAAACTEIETLCERIIAGCGAVIISEEALTTATSEMLQEILDKQEPWSDLPIILLTSADVVRATEIFSRSGNISLLERPFSRLTLIRSTQVALRARAKQYEVYTLMQALQKSKDEAERANLAKSQFLANMSHEIRTPIGAIMGFIDLIKNSNELRQENFDYMRIIDRNSQQLLRLIDDILDLSKVEAGKMIIEQLPFQFSDFLADFISNMRFKAAEKGLQFRAEVKRPIPDLIISDPVRLRQILSNVVGNAIKFTDQGSVELHIDFENPTLRFTVSDTGIGLSPAQAAKLFQPFAQADSSTTRKFGGTGLGLVLSRKLAQALNGSLELVSSSPGFGSTFSIIVEPTYPPEMKMVTQRELAAESTQRSGRDDSEILRGLKVLVIEDSPDNQLLVAAYLRKTGARITLRSNGLEGIEAALKDSYDVLLMDVQMPVMDGHEATQKLRRYNYSKPIIALTAHAMNEEKMRCLASGFTDYLTKPIQKVQLIGVLSRYLPADPEIQLLNH